MELGSLDTYRIWRRIGAGPIMYLDGEMIICSSNTIDTFAIKLPMKMMWRKAIYVPAGMCFGLKTSISAS